MKVFYISSMFEDEFLNTIYDKGKTPNFAANKYHQLLIEGLAENDINVNTYSVLPVSRSLSSKLRIKIPKMNAKNITKNYISFLNIKIVKHIIWFFKTFLKVIILDKNTTVIYDALVVSASLGGTMAAKIRNIKTVAIVTDLPEFINPNKRNIKTMINNQLFLLADGFIFLTKQMNDKCNKLNCPFIVLEGHVDSKMITQLPVKKSNDKKILLYAGSIDEKYGIGHLVTSFMNCCKANEELHIYGDGDYKGVLENICKTNTSIKYFGAVSNTKVVLAELEATLLVNPRTTEGEYTKYSFPSKTLEYMVSGTPVLCAKLDGIPVEYDQYLFYFDDQIKEGLTKKIREILDRENSFLVEQGKKAREFALEYKSNIMQAKKIQEFIMKLNGN